MVDDILARLPRLQAAALQPLERFVEETIEHKVHGVMAGGEHFAPHDLYLLLTKFRTRATHDNHKIDERINVNAREPTTTTTTETTAMT